MKSKILVFIQFAMIFLMLLPIGTPTSYLYLGVSFIVIGGAIGLAALSINKLGNFNIRPDIKEDCTLITEGIYRYIRHPMYTSVLLSMLGMMFIYLNPFTMSIYAILLVNMLIKMFYEESLWHCHSDAYKTYTQNTSRLIPKVF